PPTPSSPPPPPRVAPEGPLADYAELPGEEVIAKAELPIQEAIDRNLPDGAEAQLLADNGGTAVLGLVRKHNETELIRGIWAFQADGGAGELLDAVDQFYGQAGHDEFGDLPNGVRGRYLAPPEDAENPIYTFRAHYVAGGAVIRVEAFGPDEEAAREAFLALLREQTTEHAPE
ncbi:hypothetical protein, partial [Actinoalloteichus spitiensis]|uniref:hypothetical protein n=1 Tax=Actinoalloteichus spitiensis TaxID=252394 RepID=UPI0005855417